MDPKDAERLRSGKFYSHWKRCTIDLHWKSPRTEKEKFYKEFARIAEKKFYREFERARENNVRVLIVITGVGKKTLHKALKEDWINHPDIRKHVLGFCQAPKNNEGAFHVRLINPNSKHHATD